MRGGGGGGHLCVCACMRARRACVCGGPMGVQPEGNEDIGGPIALELGPVRELFRRRLACRHEWMIYRQRTTPIKTEGD